MKKELLLKHRDTINLSEKNCGDLVYIGVYTTQMCNLACKYCFEDSAKPAKNETTLDERITVINEAKKLGAEVMIIAGAGEPLMDKKLFSMIEHAHKLNMGTLLYTNSLEDTHPISRETAAFLYSHDVTPMIKLESLYSEPHEYLTGVEGSHKKAMNSIEILLEQGYGCIEDNVTRIGAAALYTTQNLAELPDLSVWCATQGIKLVVDVIGFHGRAKNHKDILPTKEQIQPVQQILGRESGIAASGNCIFWKYGLTIDHEGDARFCTEIDTNDIGNIRQYSVKELLNIKNEKYPPTIGKFTCPLKSVHYLGTEK